MAGKRRTLIPRSQTRERTLRSKTAQRPKGETERLAVRRLAVMKYRLAGASYRAIAEKLTEERAQAYADEHGVSFERAHEAVAARLETHGLGRRDGGVGGTSAARTEMPRADLMALENARVDQVFSKALSLFAKGRGPAGRLAIAVMGRRAKLNGLDAPTKIAPTDPTGEHQADTGAIDVNTLSEDTLRRVLRDEKREQDAGS